jgi:CheY-like chemotaxis protein
MQETFLIVEDQENDVILLKFALLKTGLHNPVQVVENGQQAIDYLSGKGIYADRKKHPLPSLVFLDLKMPIMHGFDVLQWIRRQSDLAPMVVVVLSASNVQEDITQAYHLGAHSYVVKPASLELFLETLKDFRNWWVKHDKFRAPHPVSKKKLEVCGLPEA